ncbi:MAG: hypothetical protein QM270_02890 [Bacillota bacterium]|nr:hypothetical protein [Bacillota bacterium]
MKINQHDRDILRRLAEETASIAALPVQEETRELWRRLNALDPVRPMVMIDQVCWNEMNVNDELTLRCEGDEARAHEQQLRRQLYQWRHFPVDQVVDAVIRIRPAVSGLDFGISVERDAAVYDETSDVRGQLYHNQLTEDSDLERIRMPELRHDTEETARRLAWAEEVFGNLLEVEMAGVDPYLSVWDPITTWMGAEDLLFALIDRPDFMLALAERMVRGYLLQLDQLEEAGLLTRPQPLIHCTGAWTDELPAPGYDPARPRTQDIWMFGLAQIFASVSPEMFLHYEIEPNLPLFERFGLVYYGCCDPLDQKMDAVRLIPNLRKVSMSPWVDERRGAARIGSDYVYSRKPSPAQLAGSRFDENEVRRHLADSIAVCREFGCPLELILKDISSVRYDPERLWRWAGIAMELVRAGT